jgi:hypothetical protein
MPPLGAGNFRRPFTYGEINKEKGFSCPETGSESEGAQFAAAPAFR